MSSNIPQPPSASAASWRDTVMREVGDTGEPLYYLADGRNRLDAIELAGFNTIATKRSRGRAHRRREGMECGLDLFLGLPDRLEVAINYISPPDDTYAFVVSANIHRRHLTPEQRRDIIAMLLKVDPAKSNRQIGEAAKASHVTVGAVRAELETTGQIDQLEKSVGADGKARKRKPKPKGKGGDKGKKETITYKEVVNASTALNAYGVLEEHLLDALRDVNDHSDCSQATDCGRRTIEKLEEVLGQMEPEEAEAA